MKTQKAAPVFNRLGIFKKSKIKFSTEKQVIIIVGEKKFVGSLHLKYGGIKRLGPFFRSATSLKRKSESV